MVTVTVICPTCKSEKISKNGTTKAGIQRYISNNKACATKSFRFEYKSNGWKPGIDETIIKMATNASGIRDTARVLGCLSKKFRTFYTQTTSKMQQSMI